MMAEREGNEEKKVMLVGFDDTEHSIYALKWTLDHFFAGSPVGDSYKLVVLHSTSTPSSIIGIGGPGAADVLSKIESEIRKNAVQALEKARSLCLVHSVTDVAYEPVQGDARNVLCDAVDKYQADVLVVGSHGYGKVKRAVLGSVSDYCTHHAHCTVMIVKKPKQKH